MRKTSADGNADLTCQIDVIVFHSLFDPVEHKADKAVFIKISDKASVFFGNSGSITILLWENNGDSVIIFK